MTVATGLALEKSIIYADVVAGTPIDIPWNVLDVDDLEVVYNVESVAVRGTDYSVTLNEVEDYINATVTPTAALVAKLDGVSPLVIRPDMDYSQQYDASQLQNLPPIGLERALDRAVLQIRQLQEQVLRSIKMPIQPPEGGATLPNSTATYLGLAADGTITLLTAPGTLTQPDFATTGEAAAAEIPAAVEHFRTAGYATAGDGGAGLYKRVALEPSHGGKIQNAVDSSWWELRETAPRPEQLGAVGLGVTADDTAVQRWADYLVAKQVLGVATGKYKLATGFYFSDPDHIAVLAYGSAWTASADILAIDVNARADPTYTDNESRQNFTWLGGEFTCSASSPTKATAFRAFGLRKSLIHPDKIDGFVYGIMAAGKDTNSYQNIKFFGTKRGIFYPPWSIVGGPLLQVISNVQHSHGSINTPCVESYAPLNDSVIRDCSYNLGTGSSCIAIDLHKDVLLGVETNTETWAIGETITGQSSGATATLAEVFDHPFPFQVSQFTRYLVCTGRTGTFTPGETLEGGTSTETAVLADNQSPAGEYVYAIQNPSWSGFRMDGANHFEVGTGGAGAIGVRLRDRINAGADAFGFDLNLERMFVSGGGAIGVDLQNIKRVRMRGYWSLESGGTDKILRTDSDCEDIEIAKPFYAPFGTIDLNGMARDELDLSAFDFIVSPPADMGLGGTLSSGSTAATGTSLTGVAKQTIGGLYPKRINCRSRLSASTASSASLVRFRTFATGVTAAASKQSHEISGRLDSENYWTNMQLDLDSSGECEFDGVNTGGGTVSYSNQAQSVHY